MANVNTCPDSGESSSDECFEKTMRPVLPVANFNEYDPSVPPQSGAEYLRRVQLEAKKEPKFKVATNLSAILKSPPVPTSNFLEEIDNDEFIPSKPEFRLSPSAVSQVIDSFKCLRQELEQQRRKHNGQTIELKRTKKWWRNFCLNRKDAEDGEQSKYRPHLQYNTNLPRLSLLSQLEQHLLILLLKYHCQWIEEQFTVGNGLWIYSLLVALDDIQTGDVYSLLREICRLCSRIRHRIEVSLDQEKPLMEQLQQISSLNMIIIIIGQYFGQKDLVDP